MGRSTIIAKWNPRPGICRWYCERQGLYFVIFLVLVLMVFGSSAIRHQGLCPFPRKHYAQLNLVLFWCQVPCMYFTSLVSCPLCSLFHFRSLPRPIWKALLSAPLEWLIKERLPNVCPSLLIALALYNILLSLPTSPSLRSRNSLSSALFERPQGRRFYGAYTLGSSTKHQGYKWLCRATLGGYQRVAPGYAYRCKCRADSLCYETEEFRT